MQPFCLDPIDFSACEQEPIRHLGLIQPHGALIAFGSDGCITHASDNLRQFLGLDAAQALGQPVQSIIGSARCAWLASQTAQLKAGQVRFGLDEDSSHRFHLYSHQRGNKTVLEFLTNLDTPLEDPAPIASQIEQLRDSPQLHTIAQSAAELSAKVTGYDRVMIYRFLEDWAGEVIVEIRQQEDPPYLGLRFPATDIPPQARQLYLENPLRVVAAVESQPIGLLASPSEPEPLDLSLAQLRSVSPYHIEYLKNLGVGATGTASILVHGRLWGLIACHHSRQKQLSPLQQSQFEQIASALGQGLGRLEQLNQARHRRRLKADTQLLRDQMAAGHDPLQLALFGEARLCAQIHAAGAAIWSPFGILRVGEAPTTIWIDALVSNLMTTAQTISKFSSLEELEGAASATLDETPQIAGAVALRLGQASPLFLLCFRKERIREVLWGGDIRQPVLRDERTGKLSPRRSFAVYKESIANTCLPWSEDDLRRVDFFGELLGDHFPSAISREGASRRLVDQTRKAILNLSPFQNTVLDTLSEGVSLLFSTDTSGCHLRYLNRTLLDWLELNDLTGTDPSTMEEILAAAGIDNETFLKLNNTPADLSIPTGANEWRNLRVEMRNALELTDAEGTLGLGSLIFSDLTRAERGRAALEAAEAQARHGVAMKSAFLANMSHEIRTPMNGLLGMLQALERLPASPDQERCHSLMRRSGEALLKIIDDVLDLGKLEGGRVELESTPFHIERLVEDVAALLRPVAQEKQLDLSVSSKAIAHPDVLGDPNRLRQVLTHITSNAIKFTPSGSVSIELIESGSDDRRGLFKLFITDTGIGISDQQARQIFRQFGQADVSTTRKYGGSGLGLVISRKILKLMGGEISFRSKPGHGTTFEISLPLLIGIKTPEAKLARSGSSEPLRILLAEDNLVNQIVVLALLEDSGHRIDTASNGREALQKWRSNSYDLILMDCHMPEMDGFEATIQIRREEAGQRRIPILALTADVLPADRRYCLDCGMDDHLSKPVRHADLVAAIEKWSPHAVLG